MSSVGQVFRVNVQAFARGYKVPLFFQLQYPRPGAGEHLGVYAALALGSLHVGPGFVNLLLLFGEQLGLLLGGPPVGLQP